MKDLYKNIILFSILMGMILLSYWISHNDNRVDGVEVSQYVGKSMPVFVPNYSVMLNIQDLIVDNTSMNINNVSGDK